MSFIIWSFCLLVCVFCFLHVCFGSFICILILLCFGSFICLVFVSNVRVQASADNRYGVANGRSAGSRGFTGGVICWYHKDRCGAESHPNEYLWHDDHIESILKSCKLIIWNKRPFKCKFMQIHILQPKWCFVTKSL